MMPIIVIRGSNIHFNQHIQYLTIVNLYGECVLTAGGASLSKYGKVFTIP